MKNLTIFKKMGKQAFFQLFKLKEDLYFSRSDFIIGLLYIFIFSVILFVFEKRYSFSFFMNVVSLILNTIFLFLFLRIIWKRMSAIKLSHLWLLIPAMSFVSFLIGLFFILYWVVIPITESNMEKTLSKEEFMILFEKTMGIFPLWKNIFLNVFPTVSSAIFSISLIIGLYFLLKKNNDIVVILKENKQDLVSIKSLSELQDIESIQTENKKL